MKTRFIYKETIDSTNDEIRRRAEAGEEEGLVISAGEQTKGKGRSGHSWSSPKHNSIATSILLRPDMEVEAVSQITIVAAMAVSRAIEKLYSLETNIKWPNDVVISGKKICGILTEMMPQNNRSKYVIVGIGINVHDEFFPKEIAEIATSIDIELGGRGRGSRSELTQALWAEFGKLYEIFLQTQNLEGLKEEYNKKLINIEKTVHVMSPQGDYDAISKGIDGNGRLLVSREGKMERIDSGEVHIRGLYGYV
jgi:BirA family biotin operon repressor/biotin-[acetyl-CoA-carboxylase] ligase